MIINRLFVFFAASSVAPGALGCSFGVSRHCRAVPPKTGQTAGIRLAATNGVYRSLATGR